MIVDPVRGVHLFLTSTVRSSHATYPAKWSISVQPSAMVCERHCIMAGKEHHPSKGSSSITPGERGASRGSIYSICNGE